MKKGKTYNKEENGKFEGKYKMEILEMNKK